MSMKTRESKKDIIVTSKIWMVRIIIRYWQINQILVLNNPWRVDIQSLRHTKINQTKPTYSWPWGKKTLFFLEAKIILLLHIKFSVSLELEMMTLSPHDILIKSNNLRGQLCIWWPPVNPHDVRGQRYICWCVMNSNDVGRQPWVI